VVIAEVVDAVARDHARYDANMEVGLLAEETAWKPFRRRARHDREGRVQQDGGPDRRKDASSRSLGLLSHSDGGRPLEHTLTVCRLHDCE
jgi:hypothetical protein